MASLEVVVVKSCPVQGEGIQHLAALGGLRCLSLTELPVADQHVDWIRDLELLENLDLSDTRIGDATARGICEMRSLRFLLLGHTSITDSGVRALTNLPSLESLDISGCRVGDSCLLDLAKMRTLKDVGLVDTDVSRSGYERFCHLRPDLANRVYWREAETRTVVRTD